MAESKKYKRIDLLEEAKKAVEADKAKKNEAAETANTTIEAPEITNSPETAATDSSTAKIKEANSGEATPPEATATAESMEADRASESAPGSLNGYLTSGYYKGEGKGKYLDPALVDETAKEIAKGLAAGDLEQSAFNPILRELKRANKKTLPMEAKTGAIAGAIPQAKHLVQRHRAPGLLVDILERNKAAVQDDADYTAAVKHLTAVGVFLADCQE